MGADNGEGRMRQIDDDANKDSKVTRVNQVDVGSARERSLESTTAYP